MLLPGVLRGLGCRLGLRLDGRRSGFMARNKALALEDNGVRWRLSLHRLAG
jgi:hypothetical protein